MSRAPLQIAGQPLEAVRARLEPLLQEGDLIFLDTDRYLFKRVAEATGGWTSHVGTVFREAGGWVVYESTFPLSRRTPLAAYLRRTTGARLAVMRLEGGLDGAQRERLRAAAARRLGRLYHWGFDLDSRRQFCSKYVHEVFREALGVTLGRVETFDGLMRRNPRRARRFWRLWYLGRIPLGRRTLSPQSLLEDPRLEAVLESR